MSAPITSPLEARNAIIRYHYSNIAMLTAEDMERFRMFAVTAADIGPAGALLCDHIEANLDRLPEGAALIAEQIRALTVPN